MPSDLALLPWDAAHLNARRVRDAVFIREQNVPEELEWDEMDPVSIHALAFDPQGRAIGTGRLLPDGHIGRMAVMPEHRRKGIGGRMLSALVEHARQQGHTSLVLHAQSHAKRFYSSHGFVAEGSEFMEAGIPHVLMRQKL